jgi:hypothetical protein
MPALNSTGSEISAKAQFDDVFVGIFDEVFTPRRYFNNFPPECSVVKAVPVVAPRLERFFLRSRFVTNEKSVTLCTHVAVEKFGLISVMARNWKGIFLMQLSLLSLSLSPLFLALTHSLSHFYTPSFALLLTFTLSLSLSHSLLHSPSPLPLSPLLHALTLPPINNSKGPMSVVVALPHPRDAATIAHAWRACTVSSFFVDVHLFIAFEVCV